MADVRITYSPDKAAAAERIREAIAAEGYEAFSDPISDLEDLLETNDRKQPGTATLLVWSRPLVTAALRPGLLRQLRQQRNLIEVSPDGVGPQAPSGDSHVIMLSGWRGQPFHPGWQRIATELKRLSVPRTGAPAAPPVSTSRPTNAAEPPPKPKAVAGGSSGGRRGLILASLAALGLVSAVGAGTWIGNMGDGGPREDPPAKARSTIPSPSAEISQSAAPLVAATARQPVQATTIPASTSEPADREALAAGASSAADPASPSARQNSGATRKESRKAATAKSRSDAPAPREIKPYSRRNSKVMRLFCEGSGRSTPQCRTFLRSTAARRR